MLPGLDGLSVLKAARAAGVRVPVLILSALAAPDERVRGLREGGDDYLVKPFAFVELPARVEALIRRGAARGEAKPTVQRPAALDTDRQPRKVTPPGRPILLQEPQFTNQE